MSVSEVKSKVFRRLLNTKCSYIKGVYIYLCFFFWIKSFYIMEETFQRLLLA